MYHFDASEIFWFKPDFLSAAEATERVKIYNSTRVFKPESGYKTIYYYFTSNNSTSKTRVALGGITPPAPLSP